MRKPITAIARMVRRTDEIILPNEYSCNVMRARAIIMSDHKRPTLVIKVRNTPSLPTNTLLSAVEIPMEIIYGISA